jgi:hypothetical protein
MNADILRSVQVYTKCTANLDQFDNNTQKEWLKLGRKDGSNVQRMSN